MAGNLTDVTSVMERSAGGPYSGVVLETMSTQNNHSHGSGLWEHGLLILMTLVPVGAMQTVASFERGFWWARSYDFYAQPEVQRLLWLRMIPDSIFILVGVLPLVAAGVYGLFHLRAERKPASTQVWVPDPQVDEVEATAWGD
jgi:hypothetical protein